MYATLITFMLRPYYTRHVELCLHVTFQTMRHMHISRAMHCPRALM